MNSQGYVVSKYEATGSKRRMKRVNYAFLGPPILLLTEQMAIQASRRVLWRWLAAGTILQELIFIAPDTPPIPADPNDPANYDLTGYGWLRAPFEPPGWPGYVDVHGDFNSPDPAPDGAGAYVIPDAPYRKMIVVPDSGPLFSFSGPGDDPAWPRNGAGLGVGTPNAADLQEAMLLAPDTGSVVIFENGMTSGRDPVYGDGEQPASHGYDRYYRPAGVLVPPYTGEEIPGQDGQVYSVPHIPRIWPQLNPNVQRFYQTARQEPVNERVRSRTRERELERMVVVQPTVGPPQTTLPPLAPPRRDTKEKKVITRSKAIAIQIAKALDNISEASEVVDALYEALPKDVRKRWEKDRFPDAYWYKDKVTGQWKRGGMSRGPADQFGQYGIDGADWKLEALWYNFHKIDAPEAIKNVIYNQVEDKLYGKAYAAKDRLTGRGKSRNPRLWSQPLRR